MSGGMQRRLELACALVHEPTLLFLDEPTAGIDPILRATVWDELHRLRDAGRTLLVTTQYVGDAEECDSVALIADGRLVALGHPDELRAEALGGEVIDVETSALFDATAIDNVPGVVRVDQRGPREFTAIRSTTRRSRLPAVVDAVKAAGSEVVSAQEIRPSASTRSSPSSWNAPTLRRRRESRPRSRRTRRGRRHEPLQDPHPNPRVRRQGARRGRPPARRARQPDPRAVPGHGDLRRRLQRLPPATNDRDRRPAGVRPADRCRGVQRDLRRRASRWPRSRPTRRRPTQRLRRRSDRRRPRRAGRRRGAASGRANSRSSRSGSMSSTRSIRTTPTFLARALEREVNRIIVERIAEEGQTYALSQGAERGRRRSRRRSWPPRRRPRSTTSRLRSRASSSSSGRPCWP